VLLEVHPVLNDSALINRIALWLAIASSLAIAWSAFSWANTRGAFALRQVAVTTALTELDPGVLESAIRSDLRGTFFTVSPHRVRTTLKKLPWVRDVVVERRWPMALDVRVEEYRAIGYWGENELLSDSGEIFRATSRAPLPRFEGPAASSTEVVARYRESKLALAPLGLEVKSMNLSSRGAITLQTKNDVVIEFGREQFSQRLNRFTSLYNSWSSEQRSALARVDLRYKSAIAVARNSTALALPNSQTINVPTQGNAL
jgi:cell division protein FtsQ